MIRFQAVNDTVILIKDKDVNDSPLILPQQQSQNMYEIPEPYTGIIDSVGMENEWKRGDHVAFCDIGGVYMKVDDVEYVVITPEMIIGKL
jgi:co-chaperonin GroES (HSP10)